MDVKDLGYFYQYFRAEQSSAEPQSSIQSRFAFKTLYHDYFRQVVPEGHYGEI